MAELRGAFWVFVLYDVADEIRLEDVRRLLGSEAPPRQPSFKNPAPDYVRFERPPVVQHLEPGRLETGEHFERRIKYFDYGVISVEFEMSFEAGWQQLVKISSRWINAPEIEVRSVELARTHIEGIRSALVQPYATWVSEDYYVIQLQQALDDAGQPLTATDMIARRGAEIAQIVRGESIPLSEGEQREVLQSSLSYYPPGSAGRRMGRGAGLRYSRGCVPGDPNSGICEHPVARVPALRRPAHEAARRRL